MVTAKPARRIVVGIDGTAAGAAALRWAMAEAVRRGAGLDVVHAWHPPLMTMPDGVVSTIDAAPFELSARATLEDALDTAGVVPGVADVRALPVFDSPAGALVERSRTASMVVVGSRHRPGHGSRLGSVTQQCVLHAECPVVVVPRGWTAAPRRGRVVVGVDGSAAANDALAWAAEAAVARHAALDVVHAWQLATLPRPLHTRVTAHREDVAKDSQRLLEHLIREAPEPWPDEIEQHSVEGRPADALCAAAEQADLLVIGSRGRGGFARLLLGSVSQRCLHHTPCPVAVVRHPAARS